MLIVVRCLKNLKHKLRYAIKKTKYKCWECHQEFFTVTEAREHFTHAGTPHGVHKIGR